MEIFTNGSTPLFLEHPKEISYEMKHIGCNTCRRPKGNPEGLVKMNDNKNISTFGVWLLIGIVILLFILGAWMMRMNKKKSRK
jgi:hypothetical protein